MGDPKRIEVMGPLVAYRYGFVEELAGQGYTTNGVMHQVWLMAHVSRWLESRGLGVGDVTHDRVEEFVEVRRAAGYTDRLSQRSLSRLLGYLHGLGVTPTPWSGRMSRPRSWWWRSTAPG